MSSSRCLFLSHTWVFLPLEAAISLFIQGIFMLESLGLFAPAPGFVLRLVYFWIFKKGLDLFFFFYSPLGQVLSLP